MKKETTITLNAEETETYERYLRLLSHTSMSDIKPIDDSNDNKPIRSVTAYKVSREFMFNVEQLINTVSGEEFNFLD